MHRLSTVCGVLILLLTASAPAQAQLKFEPTQPASPASACPPGATSLCIPLDASFSVVRFDGAGGNGEADPADPCQRNDDDISLSIPLGFTFDFYGSPQTDVFINNNGNLSFGGGFSEYTATGFPVAGFPMIAPFWADVETRDDPSGFGGGVVYYKLEAHRLTVIWDHVGYYLTHHDMNNTFEVIISDGTDPLVGIGNNVCFCYDDMQWTTGDASGGVGGFGGVAATVGINKGDGVLFAQIGRFDHAGADYDGPFGLNDGVSYLDFSRFCFNTSTSENIPPIPGGFPGEDDLCVDVGNTLTLTTTFVSPESGQTTHTVVDLMGLANATVTSVDGNPSTQVLTFTPDASQVGTHIVQYTATDDGTPPETTVVNLSIRVGCPVPALPTTWGHIKSMYH